MKIIEEKKTRCWPKISEVSAPKYLYKEAPQAGATDIHLSNCTCHCIYRVRSAPFQHTHTHTRACAVQTGLVGRAAGSLLFVGVGIQRNWWELPKIKSGENEHTFRGS